MQVTSARSRLLSAVAVVALLLNAPAARAEEPVKVDAKLAAPTAEPGDTVEVRFHLVVPLGEHVFPPGPATDAGIPVEATLDPLPSGITVGPLEPIDAPREIEVPSVGKVKVLEGTFDLRWKLLVAKDAQPGLRAISGTFSYQACNAKMCFRPKQVPFALTLDVSTGLSPVPVGTPIELPAEPAHATLAFSPEKAEAGGLATIALDIFTAPGFHVYAPDSKAGTPTTLELQLPAGFALDGALTGPPGKDEVEPTGDHGLIYEGHAHLTQRVRVPAGATGNVTIPAEARWQACDDKACHMGKEKAELVLTIVTAGTAPVSTATAPTVADSQEETSGKRGLVLTAILAGLLNLLMPCTLPMIPITISIFSKGKKLTKARTAFRAATYAAGIVISFALVGGVVQAVFHAEGQGLVRTAATNGPLNLAIAALFVYLGLSFFGLYDVELPYFLRRLVQKGVDKARAAKAEGETGVPLPALFLMGFFFVVTSYTCGAPIILGLLTASTPSGDVILAMTVFGATMAVPFFVLALVPALLQSLPKGGNWFKTFKVVLGTLEIAAALKFLSNADLYWSTGILTRPVFLAIWVVAGAFATAYTAHLIRLGGDDAPAEGESRFKPRSLLAAAPLLAATLYLLWGLAPGHRLTTQLEAFLPPEAAHIPPYESLDQALAAAQKSQKRLFLEFTGHQCSNCRAMEGSVLIAPRVQETFKNLELASLYTDARSKAEEANLDVQTSRFKSSVIPAYYVVDPKTGAVLSEWIGQGSEDEFLAFLQKGLTGRPGAP
jgi:thiol:disulfide interchange protein DsbD